MKTVLDWEKIRVLGNICDEQIIDDFETSNSTIMFTEEKYEGNSVIEMKAESNKDNIDVNIDSNVTSTSFKQNDNITLIFNVTDKKTGKLVHDKNISVYYDAGTKYEPVLELISSGKLDHGVFKVSYYEESLYDYEIVVKIDDTDIKKEQRFTVHVLTELMCYMSETPYNYVYEFFEEDNLNNIKNKLAILVEASYKDKNGKYVSVVADVNKNYVIDKSKSVDGVLYWNKSKTHANTYYGGSLIIKLTNADYYVSFDHGKDDDSHDGKTIDTAFKTLDYCINHADVNRKTIYIHDYPRKEKKFASLIDINKSCIIISNPNESEGWAAADNDKWFSIHPDKFIILKNFGFTTQNNDYYFNSLTVVNHAGSGSNIIVDRDYVVNAFETHKQPEPHPIMDGEDDKLELQLDSNVNEVIFNQGDTATVTGVVTDRLTQQPVMGASVVLEIGEKTYTNFTNANGVATFNIPMKNNVNEVIYFSAGLHDETLISKQEFMLKVKKKIHVFMSSDDYNYYYHICCINRAGQEFPVNCTLRYRDYTNNSVDVFITQPDLVLLKEAVSEPGEVQLIYHTEEYYWNGVIEDGATLNPVKIIANRETTINQREQADFVITLHKFIDDTPIKGVRCQITVFNETKDLFSDDNGEIHVTLIRNGVSSFNVHAKYYMNDVLIKETDYFIKVSKKIFCDVIRTDTEYTYNIYIKDENSNIIQIPDNNVSVRWINKYDSEETMQIQRGTFKIKRSNIKDDDYQNILFLSDNVDLYHFQHDFKYTDTVSPNDPLDDPVEREDIKTDIGDSDDVGRGYITIKDYINSSSGVIRYIKENDKVPATVNVYNKTLSFSQYLYGVISSFNALRDGKSVNTKIVVPKKTKDNDDTASKRINIKLEQNQVAKAGEYVLDFFKTYSNRFPNHLKYPEPSILVYKVYSYLLIRQLEFYKTNNRLPRNTTLKYPFS